MQFKSLTELKQANAEQEKQEQAGQLENPDELETLQEETEELEEQTGQSDDPDDEDDSKEVPEWMQTDEDGEPDTSSKNLMPVKSHVRKRKALQGEIKAKDDVIAELQQQVAQLQQGTANPAELQQTARPQGTATPLPKLRDFDDEEDPETAFAAAMVQWSNAQVDARQNQNAQQQQATARKQRLDTALDGHYERAATLISDGSLDPEEYKAADSLLRQTADTLQPGRGDEIVNTLLASIGDGSEKVVISMRKASNLNKFFTALQNDPTGLSVSIMLGKMAAKFENARSSRVSSAPAPGKRINKGSSGNAGSVSAKERKFKRDYDAAHKVGDRNHAFTLKREAKKAGIDTTKW